MIKYTSQCTNIKRNSVFQMRKNSQQKRTQVFKKYKRSIKRRLKKKRYKNQPKPIMTGKNIHYELSDKTQAMNYGGLGAIHKMVKQIGLDQEIDNRLDPIQSA